ncbi:penicillin-binding transpeptidase domain-containing protein [Paenibacillus sp. 32352]|uniref:penicillin-binding transpeptidase domain-containing protein n=1 Tax=Paenibacillus sp. 32352 TaxID=1969111 RepID=UPI0021174CE7|nr:penicillin-binding transpeptidase domain-containing protein [Paenibacillus sp. 32352]
MMNKKTKLRSLLIGGVFTLLFVAIVGRLYWVQIVDGKVLLAEAQKKWESEEVIRPVRGMIFDRNGNVLAEDAPAYTVALNPKIIQTKGIQTAVTKGLAAILKTSDDPAAVAELEDKIRKIVTKEYPTAQYPQVELRNEGWKIDAEVAEQIKQLSEELKKQGGKPYSSGITLIEEQKRFYPGGKLAAHLLGYDNKEGKPVMGLELSLDKDLKGIPGYRSYEKDLHGVELPDAKVNYVPAVDGNNVKLTIDKNIQYYMESALEKVYNQYHPKSLTAIAADPKTMEILGMVSLPNFNPNKYWESKPEDFFNNAVASQYEPGSTFKIVTLAASVEEGKFNPNDTFQSGSIAVPGNRLHDHNIVGWGPISYLEGLKRSSNVAFVKLGYEKLGPDLLRQYILKFGFGAKTGIDIAGEVKGVVNMKNPVEFATATYGQGPITTTSIQQTAAYGAIANGGKLMWPHVVKEIYNPRTKEVVQSFEPKFVKQVVSESTAKQVSELLEQVVSDQKIGTGKKAAIEGYRVAGKTGTANVVEPGGKGYSPNKWVISFIGFAPVEDPKILVSIIADQPDLGGNYHLGSDVAPPAFKEIVAQSLRYMGVPSSSQQQKAAEKEVKTTTLPDLVGMTLEQARTALNKYDVVVEAIGKGAKITSQSPAPGTEIGSTQRIYVTMQENGDSAVPDLTGKSLRDALEVCTFIKAKCQSSGEGYVASQTVSTEGDTKVVTLQLKPYNELLQTPINDSGGTKSDKKDTGKAADPSKGNEASGKKVAQSGR